jgi:hypothetical protein
MWLFEVQGAENGETKSFSVGLEVAGAAPITGPELNLFFFRASTDFMTDSVGEKISDARTENMLPPFI